MTVDPVYRCYSVARWFSERHMRLFAYVVRALMRVVFACDVPYGARVGRGTKFPHHALAVVIHPDAVVGENCTVSHQVTIGGRSGLKEVPMIGDRVLIGCGATLLGPIVVGDDAVIGAGAVVLADVPAGATAVGVPARIVVGEGNGPKL
ncbi:serine O-acetyltransferase [Actinomyces ruminicola]|uniref:serine O-acetyltransferase n=1 Tax=Actinomyces ruminicola TaxID=332524 RepID=UPI003183FBF8